MKCIIIGAEGTGWEWEWQLSSDTTVTMLAAAPGVYRRFMEGGDKVPYVKNVNILATPQIRKHFKQVILKIKA